METFVRVRGNADPIIIALESFSSGEYYDPSDIDWTAAVKTAPSETTTDYLLAPTAGTVIDDPEDDTKKVVQFDLTEAQWLAMEAESVIFEVSGNLPSGGKCVAREQVKIVFQGRVNAGAAT